MGRSVDRRGVARVLACLLLMSGWACDAGRGTAQQVIDRFVAAVQSEDLDALYCLLAGASVPDEGATGAGDARRDFDAWARSRYEAYEVGRDRGGVELAEEGLLLVKTFALGKGTFYSLAGVESAEATIATETLVRFGYGQVNYAPLSPGTTFYLAAAPPGRIAAVTVPAGRGEATEEVLETVRVRWELARLPQTASCPERWGVVAARAVPGSAATTTVSWRF